MPNTKSAERRTRGNSRKETRNRSVKSKLKSLERQYTETSKKGAKEDSTTALRKVISALDKAAKTGVLHKSTASRKKSRLTLALNRAAAAPAAKK